MALVTHAYDEVHVVHWRLNLFLALWQCWQTICFGTSKTLQGLYSFSSWRGHTYGGHGTHHTISTKTLFQENEVLEANQARKSISSAHSFANSGKVWSSTSTTFKRGSKGVLRIERRYQCFTLWWIHLETLKSKHRPAQGLIVEGLW